MVDLANKAIGPYQLESQSNQGGAAKVYPGIDIRNNRKIAFKVLLIEHVDIEEAVRRFEEEIKNTRALEHPNIIPVYDSGRLETGQPFIVFPWAERGSLANIMGAMSEPFSLQQVGEILSKIVGALDYAHANGIVHRDVKPHNILGTGNGNFLLADFGIVKALNATEHTVYGANPIGLGTPAYMAPEQVNLKPVSAATDIYALGVLLYQLLTKRLPFDINRENRGRSSGPSQSRELS